MTKIEWADKTWNPVTGCSKVSTGCLNCYAFAMAARLRGMGLEKYQDGFDPAFHESALEEPYRWGKPAKIFVCSMGDLFHESIPFGIIDRIMDVINSTRRHQYQILTKRAERMAEYFSSRSVPANAWLGATVEAPALKWRSDSIRTLPSAVRFLSCEPLVEDLGELDLSGIDWVIVGGETGRRARPMRAEWVLSIKRQADLAGIPLFFKQWGAWGEDGAKLPKKSGEALLGGAAIKEWPRPRAL